MDVTSEQTGIFYPLVARGSYVEAGIKVGYVTDYFGKTIFEAVARLSRAWCCTSVRCRR